jgi:hypothetical protein
MMMNVHGGRCEMCFWGKHRLCAKGVARGVCGCLCMGPRPEDVLLMAVAGALAARQAEDPQIRAIGTKFTDYLLDSALLWNKPA